MSWGNLLEMAIIAFIVGTISFVAWKTGARNPVGTGGLDRKLMLLAAQQEGLGADVAGVKKQVEEIENRVEEIDKRAAKASDIKRLERQLTAHAEKTEEITQALAAVREDAAGRGAALDHVRRQVDALYEVIVKKGMGA